MHIDWAREEFRGARRTEKSVAAGAEMKIIRDPAEMSAAAEELRLAQKVIGLVPTLGALHEGHAGLVRRARDECETVVVSIFLNPAQFDSAEDLAKYPETLDADLELCRSLGVDVAFAPEAKAVYPEGFQTVVAVGQLTRHLCGLSRAGHFRGVTTVVAKLLNLVRPHRAYFGMKDFQQLQVVRRMVRDLGVPVEIVPCETEREADGLAVSSRNVRLPPEARRDAAAISRALSAGRRLVEGGEEDAMKVLGAMTEELAEVANAELDYAAAVDPETLEDVDDIKGEVLLALAVEIAGVRLIDNTLARPGGGAERS